MSTSATITVQNDDASASLAKYRTVGLVIDHAAMVAAKRSRADGNDLRVRYTGDPPRELKVFVQAPNTAATIVWFCLLAPVAPLASTTEYKLYWGHLGRPDPHPIQVEAFSQYRPWVATDDTGIRNDEHRVQAFFFFDGFTHKRSGLDWAPYSDGDGPDASVWNVGGTWEVRQKLLRSQWAASAANARLLADALGPGVSFPGMAKRCRARVRVPSGASTIQSGALVNAQTPDISGYFADIAPGYDSAQLGGFAGSVRVPVVTKAAVAPADTWVDLLVEIVSDQLSAVVGGASMSTTDPTFPTGSIGVYQDAAPASGGWTEWEWVAWELWDGVADGDVSVSATIPALSLPSPGLPGVARMGVREMTSDPNRQGTVLRFTPHPGDHNVYDLEFPVMRPQDYYELAALWRAQRGGAGRFSWTSPRGVAGTWRFVPGSYRPRQRYGHYSAAVQVRRDVA